LTFLGCVVYNGLKQEEYYMNKKELDEFVLIARTGGKCNKPPQFASKDQKRLWRNKLARRRRLIKKKKGDL
jgi:hypothetical protein